MILQTNSELYSSNIAYLKKDSSDCVSFILKERDKLSNHYSFDVIEGKSVTVSVNGVQLTSRHDRHSFAEERCRYIQKDSQQVHIYGFGLGDDIRCLCGKISPAAKIYVHLLNVEIFNYLLGIIELPCCDRGNIFYIAEECEFIDPRGIFSVADVVLADNQHLRSAANIESILETNLSVQMFQKHYDHLRQKFEINRSYIEKDRDVSDLFDRCSDQKFAVIASGPSLEQTCSVLSDLKNQGFIIIAVDTAGKCLTSNGTKADYVVSVDESIPTKCLATDAFSSASLIYSPVSNSSLIDLFEGRRYIAYLPGKLYDELRSEHFHSELYSSGSVAHCAVDLALKMGASEVFLFGFDFAFIDNKTHAGYEASKDENGWYLIDPNIERVFVTDKQGRPVPTSRAFRSYLYDLERYIEKYGRGVRFVNMSYRGAAIKGVESYDKK